MRSRTVPSHEVDASDLRASSYLKRTEIYYPDGRVLVRTWERGTRPAYPWLSKAVEGYIESVDRFLPDGGPEGREQAYANEEGRLNGMEANVPGMKALHWPEPPGGWDAFDPAKVGPPGPPTVVGFGQSPEEMAAAMAKLGQRWDPVMGPVLIMRGWTEDEHEDDEGENPDDLGTPYSVTPKGELVPVGEPG
jgi:hypothetical protein